MTSAITLKEKVIARGGENRIDITETFNRRNTTH